MAGAWLRQQATGAVYICILVIMFLLLIQTLHGTRTTATIKSTYRCGVTATHLRTYTLPLLPKTLIHGAFVATTPSATSSIILVLTPLKTSLTAAIESASLKHWVV